MKKSKTKKYVTVLTKDMVKAGVKIYSNPGRYETYEEVVVKIFVAMMKANNTLVVEIKDGK